jgi:hypothetical protein
MTYSLEEIKTAYKDYLNKQGLSRLTIQTALSDSFYIWKKRGSETFWNIIFSEDFEKLGERILLQTLREYSKGDVHTNVNSYMSHLRRFRKFLTGVPTKDLQTLTPRVTLVTKNKPRKVKQDLSDPCKEQVDFYLKRWDLLEDYHLQENALDKLFFELCPGNKDIIDVLLKVAALNDFYSTHIYKVFPMAKHIVSLDIDDRLKTGDVTLVRDIQKVNGINHYSFATKYCSHHRPLDFPIYDSFVDDVLCYFWKRDGFFGFDSSDLKDFALFKDILLAFRSFYGLEAFNLKQIDKYIWQLGKDYFPRNYK